MDEQKRKILINSALVFLLGALIFIAIYFGRGIYDYRAASDALFASGAGVIVIALFIWIARTGTFDILGYSFYRLGESFKPGMDKRWDTFYDFREEKKQKRSLTRPLLWPYFSMGVLLMILALIFLLLWHYA